MKWMGWNQHDLDSATPDTVLEIVRLINEEQDYIRSMSSQ